VVVAGVCLGCGRPLDPLRRSSYCADTCRWRAARGRRRDGVTAAPIAKRCLGCGLPFAADPRHPAQAYCQRVCRDRHKAGRPARRLVGPAVLGPRVAGERAFRCDCGGEVGRLFDSGGFILHGPTVTQPDGPRRVALSGECQRCQSLRLIMTFRARLPTLAGVR
jgi:hypothetical protein